MKLRFGNKGQGMGLIAGLVAIVVFVALMPTMKQSTMDTYTLTTYTNDSTVFSGGVGTVDVAEIYSVTSVQNSSTTLNASTHYNVTNAGLGQITLNTVTCPTTTFNVTYIRSAPGYLTDTSARSVGSQIFLFVILGLLIFTVGIFGLVGM